MSEEIKKIANIKVKNEPYLKPISNTGIGFYNLDENTGVLRFNITKDNKPLLVSDKNAKTYVYLESKNGSNQIVEDIRYIDPLNGIVEIIVPIEFLQASTNSEVIGQIYITINKMNETYSEKSKTAVLSEFKFEVGDALINNVSGITKIKYIRMFDELKKIIDEKADEIIRQLENMEDYIVKVENATERGITQISDVITNGKKEITDLNKSTLNDIDEARLGSLNTLKLITDELNKNIRDNGNQYITDLRKEVTNIENIISDDGFVHSEDYEEFKVFITDLCNSLKPVDSGWIPLELINGAVQDRHYKLTGQNGFNCSYKIIKHKNYNEIIVRLNADNFESGNVIAKLPEGLCKSTQTEIIRAVPTNCGGAQIVLQPNGELTVWIVDTTKWAKERNSYIYGTLSFVEDN